MLAIFESTLTPLLTMFLCIIIGYLLNKINLLPENTDTVLSKLETLILVPALIISTFMNYCTLETLSAYHNYFIISTVLIAIAICISYPLSRVFSKDIYQRNIYKYALTFGNFGFLGNAIVPIIMGEEFLYTYMLFCLPINLTCYTWGVGCLIPKDTNKKNPLLNLINPTVIAIIIGTFLGLTGAKAVVPSFIKLTLSNLSACMGPIAMVLTGFVVAKYSIIKLLKKPLVYLATLLRLIILPIIFVAVLILLKIDSEIIKMCIFAFATPLGLNTVVYPSAYGEDASTGASMALISHTLCVITIPILYMFVSTFLPT